MTTKELSYTQEQIEEWGQKLTEFAKKPKLVYSRKETVEALIQPITEALETHSYREVTEILKEWGFEISEGSLKQYVSRSKKNNSSSGKSTTNGKTKRYLKPKEGAGKPAPSNSDSTDDVPVNHPETESSGEVAPLPRPGRRIETAY